MPEPYTQKRLSQLAAPPFWHVQRGPPEPPGRPPEPDDPDHGPPIEEPPPPIPVPPDPPPEPMRIRRWPH